MNGHNIEMLQQQIVEKSAFLHPLKNEISRTIAGQDKLINRLILAMIADGHVLLEGVPGLAKTLTVKTLAQTLNGTFSRIQFTPDLLPSDLIGNRIFNMSEGTFSTQLGPVFANIVLADEINRAPSKVQSALLEAMQEKQVTIAGEKFPLPQPFLVMATQNPIEQEGTYPLPEAQIDRFMFKLKVDYPQRHEEKMILERMAHPQLVFDAHQVATLEDILEARKVVDKVYIDDKIIEYILDLVIATRPGHENELSERQQSAKLSDLKSLIDFGASPRAVIALAVAAKGNAFMNQRSYVIPQDVKDIAGDVLRHRIILSYEAEAESLDTDAVIKMLLDELLTP